MTSPHLHIHSLHFERQERTLFSNLNVEIQAGEALQVLGANGSGKTSLLRILAGFLSANQGEILWRHQNIQTDLPTYQRNLHYLGHLNGLKPHLSVLENVNFMLALFSAPLSQEKKLEILSSLGLGEKVHALVNTLSAGLARRLALAKLLLFKAPLWILDEPLTALDCRGQDLLKNTLKSHLAQGGIAIIATHQDLGQIEGIRNLNLRVQDA